MNLEYEIMKKIILIVSMVLITGSAQAQVLAMTISALASTREGQLGRALGGEWIFTKAEINGVDVLGDFQGIVLNIPKCKKADRKSGSCPPVEVSGDENTDYFKDLFGEEGAYVITSRKKINKEAKEDAIYEKVMYEQITTKNTEVEYAFKYKKKTMYIEAKSGEVTEIFEMIHQPKAEK